MPHPASLPVVAGLMDCIRKTLRAGGIRAFYPGTGCPCLDSLHMQHFSMHTFAYSSTCCRPVFVMPIVLFSFGGVQDGQPGSLPLVVKCLAKCSAAASTASHCHLRSRSFDGVFCVACDAGIVLNSIKCIPEAGIQFLVYDTVKSYMGLE